MRVKLLIHLTGTRNGAEWPGRGEEMELPDNEASSMVAAGMAEPVTKHRDSEKAVPAVAEIRKALVPSQTLKGRAK
jgi:hypothetical protein